MHKYFPIRSIRPEVYHGIDVLKHFGKNRKIPAVEFYVPTLPFWPGGSRSERTAPVLSFLAEIFRFEVILARMSNLFEFYKSNILFPNSMWKSWLIVTIFRCVRYSRLPSSSWAVESCQIKALIILAHAKEAPGMGLRINTVCNFQTMKSTVKLNSLLLKPLLLRGLMGRQIVCHANYASH